MEQQILKLKYDDKYYNGTYITIIEENEIKDIKYRIKQIMPLASGKFLIERTHGKQQKETKNDTEIQSLGYF